MLLKNAMIRGGTAFLKPSSMIIKGGQTEDCENAQDHDFVRGLRLRLG
jgi:RecQ-mediated genome instability protein 1